jgi:hypothetical protein
MTLPKSAHTSRPWRIHDLRPDLEVLDVWELPTPGGAGDFPRLVDLVESYDPAVDSSAPVRALFALRYKLGELFGWDRESDGFAEILRTDDEWALEISNATVEGVLHVGWVETGAGRYRGQLAVLVRPKGLLGRAYMAAITPFRHLVVYPTMLRDLERGWLRDQPADHARHARGSDEAEADRAEATRV